MSIVRASVKSMIDGFLGLYQPSTPRWSNITHVVSEMGWEDVVAKSMAEYLDLEGIDRRWSRELVEAATRVNYGQVRTPISYLPSIFPLIGDSLLSEC